jgi:hypothetical protein
MLEISSLNKCLEGASHLIQNRPFKLYLNQMMVYYLQRPIEKLFGGFSHVCNRSQPKYKGSNT